MPQMSPLLSVREFLMDTLSRWGLYILGILLLLRVMWLFIFKVFGAYLGSISINNGILFNDVHWHTKKISISISSVRFRLWGNSRKLVISDLNLRLRPSAKKTNPPKDNFVTGEPLSIYPGSIYAKFLIKVIIWLLPSTHADVKRFSLTSNDVNLSIALVRFNLNKHKSIHEPGVYRFGLLSSIHQFSGNVLDSKIPIKVGSCVANASCSADTTTGMISKLSSRLHCDDIELDILLAVKSALSPEISLRGDEQNQRKTNLFKGEKAISVDDAKDDRSPLERKLDKFSALHKTFFGAFQDFSINIRNSRILGIPLVPTRDIQTFGEFLNNDGCNISVSVSVSALSFTITRITNKSAGFEVLFDDSVDKPVEVNASVLTFAAQFVEKKHDESTHKSYYDKAEFFHVPNLSLATKTNLNDLFANGSERKNIVLEMFCSGSSPIFDVTTDQFGLLTYNYVVLKKMMRLHFLKKTVHQDLSSSKASPDLSSESEDDTQIASSESSRLQYPEPRLVNLPVSIDLQNGAQSTPESFQDSQFERMLLFERQKTSQFDKFMAVVNELYPRIDIKLAVEQPRTMIRSYNKLTKSTHILTMCYSMMVLRVANSSNNRYEATCDFLHPCVNYSERCDINRVEDFCGLSDFTIKCNILHSLELSASLKIHGAYLNLTKPDVLNGISYIVQEATRVTNGNLKYGLINKYFDGELAREFEVNPVRLHQKQTSETQLDKIFSNLPEWFMSASLKVTDINIKLGSTSPLLPPELISELSEKKGKRSNPQNFCDTISVLNFTISELKCSIRNSTGFPNGLLPLSASSLETLGEDLIDHMFWQLRIVLKNSKLCLVEKQKKLRPILHVPDFSLLILSLMNKLNKNLQISTEFGPLLGILDRHSIFVIIGLMYLVNETIVIPIKALVEKLGKNMANLHLREKRKSVPILEHLSYDIVFPKVNYTFSLSEDFKLCLQIYRSKIEGHDISFTFSSDLIRLLVNDNDDKGFWKRLVCLDSLKFKVNDSANIQNFVLDATAIRIIQPHLFVAYKLFDNIAIFIKIAKHLVLSMKSTEKSIIVLPKESNPLKIPEIKVRAERISFHIEDDPFECELGMIYQLGLQEQRKRLEMTDLFTEKMNLLHMSEDKRADMVNELQRSMECLWIRKVKAYKSQITQEVIRNKNYLFGTETEIDQEENQGISSYLKFAPLCHVILSGVDLELSSTRFPFRDLPQFIHDLGQGVPKDTKYNTMIPSYVDLGVREVRIHVRDYPLPLLYLPEAIDSRGNGNALIMKGHLIICEALKLARENLRELEILLTKDAAGSQPNSFNKLIIERSMTSTKLFTELDVQFGSKAPSRFVWGQAYQFAIQQIMASVDQFSKPPVDPSPKLGFWDKIRYVMHGNCVIKALDGAIIEFAFKGGRDPYDLFEKSSGFVLSFRDEVRWEINSSDDSLEFGKVKSKRVLWYIPNYLSAPLVCWCRESSKFTNFLKMDEMVTSCFGYYLNYQVPDKKRNNLTDFTICEKKVVELSGGVDFTVGFLLQRKSKDGSMTTDGKLHWEVDLCNPIYTKENHDSYVGFRSNRVHMAITLIAHTDSSYNTIHLTPGVFKQFFEWWSLFQGNMMLQVKRGKLFGETKTSATKFSEHLFTNKFLFHIKDLFLSHIYHDERDNDNNKLQFLGMRAKVSEFLVDLHQRKEERVDVHEDLARNQKVMKMNFNRAEVALTHIDLRMMYAEFYKDIYEQGDIHEKRSNRQNSKNCKYKVFDEDYQWFDDQDYIETFSPSIGGERIKMESYPFMFSEKFAFIRRTSYPDKIDWGDEHTHGCMLGNTDVSSIGIEMCKKRLIQLDGLSKNQRLLHEESVQLGKSMESLQQMKTEFEITRKTDQSDHGELSESSSEESFDNRFVLVSMFLKWNEGVRNLFLKYIHFVQLRANGRKYLSYEFITMLEGIIERNIGDCNLSLGTSASGSSIYEANNLKSILNGFLNSKDRLKNFDTIIRTVSDNESFKESFKIQVISPQIQLHSETVDTSVVLVTAPVLESKIITVTTSKDDQLMGATKELAVRYGVLLHDASVMVVDKKNALAQKAYWNTESYGSRSAWPPFLGIEICKNHFLAREEILLAEKMSMMLTYDQIKATNPGVDQKEDTREPSESNELAFAEKMNGLRVDVPELAINCTSLQYFSLYVTILSLLMYTEPTSAHLAERLLKLKFSIDFQDFEALHSRLICLRAYLRAVDTLFNNYSFRHANEMDNEQLNEYILLKHEKEELSSEICLILQTLFSGDIFTDISASAKPSEVWRIAADKIGLNILTDDRKPILALSIDHGRCKRIINEDGSNHNRIEIKNIEGRSLVKGSVYDKFLEPSYSQNDNDLITVDWSMMRPVGGIKIIENFDINSKPLNVRLDEKTGRELMNFIFHLEETQRVSQSPVLKAAEEIGPNTKEDNESSISDTKSEEIDKNVRFESDLSVPKQVKKKKSLSLFSGSDNDPEYREDVNEMLRRSKEYLTVVSMVCHPFELTISLRMKHGFKRWLNVNQFTLKLPEWTVDKKVTSFLGVTDVFKSLVIKTILRHSGLLVLNKVRTRSSNARHRLGSRRRTRQVSQLEQKLSTSTKP